MSYFGHLFLSSFEGKEQNAIKAPHRYMVQGSDTRMMPIAASLFGQ